MKITHIYLNKSIKGVIFLYFIQETDKPKFLLKLFSLPELEGNRIILPITKQNLENNEISNKKEIKITKNTIKLLNKTHCKKLILSKNLQEKEIFCNNLHTKGFEIINGKWLFALLSSKVLEYVVNTNKLEIEKIKISILANDVTDIVLENIRKIAKKYQKINIVTNYMEKFKKIEEQLLDEYGVMITLNNNKRKSLAKADIILNFDFPEELINKYRIAEKAIIVNFRRNAKIKQKRFEGKIFNDYDIVVQNLEEFQDYASKKFYIKDIYEALIYKHQPIENIMRKVEKDKVGIKFLK